jgi:hypothetical protein
MATWPSTVGCPASTLRVAFVRAARADYASPGHRRSRRSSSSAVIGRPLRRRHSSSAPAIHAGRKPGLRRFDAAQSQSRRRRPSGHIQSGLPGAATGVPLRARMTAAKPTTAVLHPTHRGDDGSECGTLLRSCDGRTRADAVVRHRLPRTRHHDHIVMRGDRRSTGLVGPAGRPQHSGSTGESGLGAAQNFRRRRTDPPRNAVASRHGLSIARGGPRPL